MTNKIKSLGIWFLLFITLVFIVGILMNAQNPSEKKLSDLAQFIKSGQVVELKITDDSRAEAILKKRKRLEEDKDIRVVRVIKVGIPSYEALKELADPEMSEQITAGTDRKSVV